MFETLPVPETTGNFHFEADPVSGLHKAVRNNQTRLANEYLVVVVDSLIKYAESLEARIEDLEGQASTASSRKVTKSKAPVASVGVDESSS